MSEKTCERCGGCPYRFMDEKLYRQKKEENLKKIVAGIKNASPEFDSPVFIADGQRRRADMEFSQQKGGISLGFYEEKSHNLLDVEHCPMLRSELNAVLPALRVWLAELCSICVNMRISRKKTTSAYIKKGSIKLLCADNGIDILLETDISPELEHRLAIADFANSRADIVRISWWAKGLAPETIVEKAAPELHIAGYSVAVPQGVFLQASKAAERAMIEKVLAYMDNTAGKIADLFCGLGTFTYSLAKNRQNEILSADSSATSLEGLRKALNRNQIQNVRVTNRNLFKEPLEEGELANFAAVVLDPPRAGAHEQCRRLAQTDSERRPQKIIYVSCNPETFAYDAGVLIKGGYAFARIVLIDQFVYSEHSEIIALFVNNSEKTVVTVQNKGAKI